MPRRSFDELDGWPRAEKARPQARPAPAVSSALGGSGSRAAPAMEKDITTLLVEVGEGDPRALSELWERVAPEVRAIASRQLRHPPQGQHVGASTVVNEVYWRLFRGGAGRRFDSRAHLLGSAARTVRCILVEHARAKRLGQLDVDLDALPDGRAHASTWAWEEGDLEALDRALRKFEEDEDDERKARIVHLRFLVGCETRRSPGCSGCRATR
jgi:RNA polymerase sigma factor (TIGR02999 family)